MSDAKSDLEELKKAISEMPDVDRHKVENIAFNLRHLLFCQGAAGQIALSLVAGEMAVMEEGR